MKKKKGCRARGVTFFTNPMMMKLTGKTHNHAIEKKDMRIIPLTDLFKPEML